MRCADQNTADRRYGRAFVLGIIGVVMAGFFMFPVAIVLGAIGLPLAWTARDQLRTSRAVAGMVLSTIAWGVGVSTLAALFVSAATASYDEYPAPSCLRQSATVICPTP